MTEEEWRRVTYWPLLLASLLFARIMPALRGIQRHASFLTSVSGITMIGLGGLFALNQSFYLSIASQRLLTLAGRLLDGL